MRRRYITKRFSPESEDVIAKAVVICEEYAQQGYDLTLRQLYYQFVSRDWLPNRQQSYNRLGSIINDARLAGLLDWDYIVDRTRNLRSLAHWDDPAELVRTAASQFKVDRWADQAKRVEVWIEKDALVGVLQSACPRLDVPYFSCRGYTSQSEVWGAAQRLGEHLAAGQDVVVIHLGDHDPSGLDMTRDIEDRLAMFIGQDAGQAALSDGASMLNAQITAEEAVARFTIERIALNMDQIEEHEPPPNPAKLTDARARGYIAEHGGSSWELDALDPATLVGLIEDAVLAHRDLDKWAASTEREESEREVLTAASARWGEVKDFLAD